MEQWVEIQFDCVPLRSVPRWDPPLDASPKYEALCQRVQDAAQKHGTHNVYYLLNARCTFHLINHSEKGLVVFRFEGAVLTDETDERTLSCDLSVHLDRETCPWLTEPIVQWFHQTVRQAVQVEFDRYIAAGDLDRTRARIDTMQAASDQAEGYLGMFL